MNSKFVQFFMLINLLLISNILFAQQNIPFAQHIFNASGINPAYSGYKENWFGQIGLRSQWTGMEGAPKAGFVSIDGVLDPILQRNGAGLVISHDRLGVQSATSVFANYALRLQIDDDDDSRLSLGVSPGFTQYSLDGSRLNPVDIGDPLVPQGMVSTFRPDIRLGVFFHTTKWYLGFAVHDLFTDANSREDFVFNQNSLESLYRKTHGYLMAGAVFDIQEGLKLRPSILLKDDLKGPSNFDINAMFIMSDMLWIGPGFRTRTRLFGRNYDNYSNTRFSSTRSINLLAQLYTNSKLRIGYSYDYMLNKVANINGSTHELTLGFSFGKERPIHLRRAKYF